MPAVVVAEKPSVARDLSAAIGASSRRDGFFEGHGFRVTWAIGHLVGLAEPPGIDPAWRSWRIETLPMIPRRWPLTVLERTRPQFEIVARLINAKDVDEIICATDAGREGELIFRYVYEAARCAKPVRRLWISSLTSDAIKKGFANLKPQTQFDGLAAAARGRSVADWLVGMNLTRAYTLSKGSDDVLSVGRVQTPTLAMIVDRDREIENFVPEDYVEVIATFGVPGPERQAAAKPYSGTWFDPTSGRSKEQQKQSMRLPPDRVHAEAIRARVLQTRQAQIHSVEQELRRYPPPLLYDLTELQRHAHRLFGLSAQRTLEVAQRLYEVHKLISYPRTDSRHLSADVEPTLSAIVSVVAPNYSGLVAQGSGTRPLGKRFVDDQKVSDHHAIIPTPKSPSSVELARDEAQVYDLICRRLLEAWHPDLVLAVTSVVTRVTSDEATDSFLSTGTVTEQLGWKVLDIAPRRDPEKDREAVLPPGLAEGQARVVRDVVIEEKQTRPPKRLTDATLLTAMETAGKALEDRELSKAMREHGLGTPATRASIIETLIDRGYIVRDGKVLTATKRGRDLVDAVHPDVKSPIMTGQWEARLAAIREGREPLDGFVRGIEAWVRSVVGRALTEPSPGSSNSPASKTPARPIGEPPRSHRESTKIEPESPPSRVSELPPWVTESPPWDDELPQGNDESPPWEAESPPWVDESLHPDRPESPRPESPRPESPRPESPRREPPRREADSSRRDRASPQREHGPSGRGREFGLQSDRESPPEPESPRSAATHLRIEPSERSLDRLLRDTFGHASFRPHQREVCEAVVRGSDALLVMPTGAGKSLCYQLPGLVRGGTTIVISPLIALMDDQVGKLKKLGVRAERIHSGMSRSDSRAVCGEYLAGGLDFLYISPERLRVAGFIQMLAKVRPALVAVDEAHCISQWGHDFRPDYRLIGERLPALRPAPVLGLTATATPRVQQDIATQLSLVEPGKFIHGFRRQNLAIEVVELPPKDRKKMVARVLGERSNRPAIVYAPSRKSADALAETLSRSMRAAAYHAGMGASVRSRVQDEFLGGQLEVVVATIAFGMGVDKANIRTVLHLALPGTLEGYYQEIGRAGRDGQPARAILLQSYADTKLHEFFRELEYPPDSVLEALYKKLGDEPMSSEELRARVPSGKDEVFERALEKLWVHGGARAVDVDAFVRGDDRFRTSYPAQRAHRAQQNEEVLRFARSTGCRMLRILDHFGDETDTRGPCGVCDQCAPQESKAQEYRPPSAEEARWVAKVVFFLKERFSVSAGAIHREVLEPVGIDRRALDRGLGALARADWVTIREDEFEKDGKQIRYDRVTLTPRGRSSTAADIARLTFSETAASSSERKRSTRGQTQKASPSKARSAMTEAKRRSSKKAVDLHPLDPGAMERAAALKRWRLSEARRLRVPAFRVLSDRALYAIAEKNPRSEATLLGVSGVGPTTAGKHGPAILRVLEHPEAIEAPAPSRRRSKRATRRARE